MLYEITHVTNYSYNNQVFLEPHILRLRSRSDSYQTLRSRSLEIFPTPAGISEILEIEGNAAEKIWFDQPTDSLTIKVVSQVETRCENPFNYLLEPWAAHLPIDYPISLFNQLRPYLQPLGANIDSEIMALAAEISYEVHNQPGLFLTQLNQRIYESCEYLHRETGEPLPPGLTWRQKSGSCRDFTLLFMAACQAVGLAARFVSGYQEGDPNEKERHLHAWAEVYLPGAGWRGFDPTHGLAVADRHIALAASVFPRYAAPIAGSIRGNARSQMQYQIAVRSLC